MKTTLLSLAVLLTGASLVGAQPALATNPSVVVDYEQQPKDFGILLTVEVEKSHDYLDFTTQYLSGITHVYGISPSNLQWEWADNGGIHIEGMGPIIPNEGYIDIYLVVDLQGEGFGHYRIRLVKK